MSDIKISQLTSGAALTGAEQLPVVQGGTTVKTTTQAIVNLAAGVFATTGSNTFNGNEIINGSVKQYTQGESVEQFLVYDSMDSNNMFQVDTDPRQIIMLPVAGNVGIGKTVPNAKLDINGDTLITGSLKVTSGITGSLFGTASYASQALSSSFATTSSYPISVLGTSIYSTSPKAGVGFSTSNGIFLGNGAGDGASSAYNSNFLGLFAGNGAVSAYNSNFLGAFSGYSTLNTSDSNFFGNSAGQDATNANNSNFFGNNAGGTATSANNSNFFGNGAGANASSANNSNFFGNSAGQGAINAKNSNFLGFQAGNGATDASHSILIGYNVGYNAAGTGIGSNNIILGTNITLADGTENSINLGGIIFATGSYSTRTGNPSTSPANGRVGINVVSPAYTLDVSGSANINDVLVLPPQNPLPSGKPVGSFAVSGSGVDCKPYFYNGISWTALL